jgi:RNA polymerase sigma-70 factor (ECF subfamily)
MYACPQPAVSSIENAVYKYGTTLFRICLAMLENTSDAEDAVQETFLRYLAKAPIFKDAEHEKAWLIRVAINHCKNLRLFKRRHTQVSLEDYTHLHANEQQAVILEAVGQLPAQYQVALQLYYLEGYRSAELADILGISDAAARKRLQKGRELLKIEYERVD